MKELRWMGKASRRCVVLTIMAGTLFAVAFAALETAQAAGPPQLWERCPEGQDAGECAIPRGIAANPSTGHIYIANQSNRRIEEFSAWGEFVRAWGWGVIDGVTEALQTCTKDTGCVKGRAGSGAGEFGDEYGPQGVAVDNAGNVYVVDTNNRRVQKFDPSGQFLLMFGGKVNKTTNGNICTAISGNECGAGLEGGGGGEFSGALTAGSILGMGPGDTVYVGDKGRIQKFDSSGQYLGGVEGAALAGETVQSLAVGASGQTYVSLLKTAPTTSKEDVLKLGPAGEVLCTLKAKNPRALAFDSTTGDIYVVDGVKVFADPLSDPVVRRFNSDCVEVPDSSFSGGLDQSTGIAVIESCKPPSAEARGVSLYVANSAFAKSFVRAYGPLPDPGICPPPIVPPTIRSQHALSVGARTAELRAQINPHFWPDATYYVQYGTEDCAASPDACGETKLFPGADLGEPKDSFITTAPVFLSDLQPGTTYYYRFVAKSGGSEDNPVSGEGEGEVGASFTTFPLSSGPKTNCGNQVFRTGSSGHLIDCRAYEMVSPVDKDSGDIAVLLESEGTSRAGLFQSANDGDRFTYSSFRAFDNPGSAPFTSQYFAKRGNDGWGNEAISPPQEGPAYLELGDLDSHYKAFDEDLCSAWILQDTEPTLTPDAIPGFADLYRRENCGAVGYEALTKVPPSGLLAKEFKPSIQGFSADSSHSIFRSGGALTEGSSMVEQLYESYGGGDLRLVCVLPDETPTTGSCSAGSYQGGGHNHRLDSVWHAISTDGTRIFWSDAAGKLYQRIGGQTTIPVSTASAFFWGAATDGSRAIYTEGSFKAGGANLVEFDTGPEVQTPIAGEVQGVMGMSDDASRVYFASKEDLGGEAEAGQPNLYLHEEGGATVFIATLASADVNQNSQVRSLVHGEPTKRVSRVSPDGLHATFMSTASLTGYDNTDGNSGEPDAEVYLYDASPGGGSGGLVCASCNPTGARPEGRDLLSGSPVLWAAAQIPSWEYQLYASRVLSADGDRLFFESFEPLVLQDTNGKQDVYEWERAEDQAACADLGAELYVAASGGCLSLISSGDSSSDSQFIDAGSSGRDVFFTTASSLLSQDPGLVDVYNAREGGGYPPPPAPLPDCEGEACQSPPAAPNDPTPASTSYRGPANPPPPRGAKKSGKHKKKNHKKSKKKKKQGKHKKQKHQSGRAGR